MIVAMVAVRVVQVAADEIIGVVAVRHGRMPAVRPMDVASGLFVRAMAGSALNGICGADGNDVIVHMPAVLVVQVAGVKVVGVTVVNDGEVAAIGAVNVRMRSGVLLVVGARGGDEGERQNEDDVFFMGCCFVLVVLVQREQRNQDTARARGTSAVSASDLQKSPMLARTVFAVLTIRS